VAVVSLETDLTERKDTEMRGVKKENLPTKTCPVCGRSFSWRKKWEKNWDEVKYCSKSCSSKAKSGRAAGKAS